MRARGGRFWPLLALFFLAAAWATSPAAAQEQPSAPTYEQKLTRLSEICQRLEALNEQLSTERTSLTASSDELKSKLENSLDEVTKLKSELASLRSELEQQSSELASLKTSSGQLQMQLASSTAELAGLRESLTKAESSLTKAEDSLKAYKAAVEQRIARLELERNVSIVAGIVGIILTIILK